VTQLVGIVYITAQTPYGTGEQFVLPEFLRMKEIESNIWIIPVRPSKNIGKGTEAEKAAELSIYIPVFSMKILIKLMIFLFIHPIIFVNIIIKLFKHSGNFRKTIKNLSVLPKAILVSGIIRKKEINHIHAHWASTPTTLAYIVHLITNIPFSFTAHRWDITENNMCKEKVKKSKFVRVINQKGYDEMIEICGEKYKDKLEIIYCGVNIPNNTSFNMSKRNKYVIATPANLLEVKGHKYLLDALSKMKNEIRFEYWIIGDGPLRGYLESITNEKGLSKHVSFLGKIPHDKLLSYYVKGKIDIIILPSINTEDDQKEGIPVALIEAMGYGVPVISTDTGGIPELIKGNLNGILVEEKNSEQLQASILKLINNIQFKNNIVKEAYTNVKDDFSLNKIINKLHQKIYQN
jgi:colanic acid/amylovoran biosynthesis glycosyltransferase